MCMGNHKKAIGPHAVLHRFLGVLVPFVKRPFEWGIHGGATLASFCCVLRELGPVVCVSRAISARMVVQ